MDCELSSQILVYSVVHTYIVLAVGIIANGVALTCIISCPKTRPAMKVLLVPVFLSPLVNNLVCRPIEAELLLGLLECDFNRLSKAIRGTYFFIYIFLTYLELMIIAAVSVFRTVAVWASNTYDVNMRVAVSVVAGLTVYTLLLPLVVQFLVPSTLLKMLVLVIGCVLPVLTTLMCYASMIIAVRRNRKRLAQLESRASLKVMDNATLAMAAVFISNLLFGFPFCVAQFLRQYISRTLMNFTYVLFNTHLAVDPLVFILFNYSHRRRICERLRLGWVWVAEKYSSSATEVGNTSAIELQTESCEKSPSCSTATKESTSERLAAEEEESFEVKRI